MKRSALLCFALLFVAPSALAEPTAAERADALFTQANTLANAGNYAEACPKYEQSFELDPALGTQFNLADCYEHTRRPATAWRLFLEVARTAGIAGKKPRQESATKRANALEPKVPRIVLAVADDNPSDLEIKHNGAVVPRAQWSQPIAIDYGTHAIEAAATGRKGVRIERAIETEGAREKIEIPKLEPVAAPPSEDPKPTPAPAPTPKLPESPNEGTSALRVTGYSLVAVGTVSLIAGGIFALRARSLNNLANEKCPATECGDPTAVDNSKDAARAATFSTITVAGGLGLVGVGVLLIVTSPSAKKTDSALRTAPIIGAGTLGWSLEGSW